MKKKNIRIILVLTFLFGTSFCSYAQPWAIIGKPGFSPGAAYNTGIATDSSNNPYIVFQDAANDYAVTVMQYKSATWNYLGAAGFSSIDASYPCLALSSKDTAFVTYVDGTTQSKVSVMKYNGTSWVYVGAPDFSDSALMVSFAIGTNDTPYVALLDGKDSSKVTVMKYNGSAWVDLGSAGFSSSSDDISLAIDRNTGVPYVAFTDIASGGNATVVNYTSGLWKVVGTKNFTPGLAAYLSLAINRTGAPILAYQDGANGNMASAMEYNGSSWVNLGGAGFSKSSVMYTSLAIDSAGVPFVAYQDAGNGSAATVAEFNGTNWVAVGSPGCTAGTATYTSLCTDRHGRLYVGFQDGAQSSYASVIEYQHCNTGTPAVTEKVTGADTVCPWSTVNISAGGAGMYAWSTGDSTTSINPQLSDTSARYEIYVTGIASNGCASTDSVRVYTKSAPVISVTISGKDTICKGDSTVLAASGALSYAWSNGATTASVTVNPMVQTAFIVTGTGSSGCSNKDTVTVYVDTNCTVGVNEIGFSRQFTLSPNPANDKVFLSCLGALTNAELKIYNTLGQFSGQYYINNLETGERYQLNISGFIPGIYFVQIISSSGAVVYKIVKE